MSLDNLNPQLPYYLMLFLLTIILRFIRAYRTRPSADTDPEIAKEYNVRYFFFGFELVNVAAGVFILLSEHATKYVGSVMILYVVLVILSFFFEDESVERKLRTGGHITVSLIVLAVTLYAFFQVDGLKPCTTSTKSVQNWRVALPYMDTALNRNFGAQKTPIQSVYIIDVPAASRIEALQAAKMSFFSEKGPSPFVAKVEKNPLTMIVFENDVVIEPRI